MLSLLVISFAFEAHLEGKVVSFARKRRKAESLAMSGMQIARMLLDKQLTVTGAEAESTQAGDRWYKYALTIKRGRAVSGLEEQLGEGTIRLDIEPEPGLRNVNLLKDEDWERIFQYARLPEEYWPELIDSFSDWIDADSKPRQDGGETEDYYATLDKPYSARNAPIETVSELLLVKGFNQAILSGGVLNPEDPKETQVWVMGVQNLLTTYGDGKVNVNAAGLDVLQTLPGIDELGARKIIDERERGTSTGMGAFEDGSFESVQDFMSRVGKDLSDSAVGDFITTRSEIFRITSIGQVGRVTRRIWAVVFFNGRDWRILRWREEP
ncbi:MAG: type II secretion system protein GspK [Kiritimatiellae bacterium]|nr:type II secretion system protein GspK [Kiritimatiellia bacterium]